MKFILKGWRTWKWWFHRVASRKICVGVWCFLCFTCLSLSLSLCISFVSLIFTCCDPFWLVFEILHLYLAFFFISSVYLFHVYHFTDKWNTWLKSFARRAVRIKLFSLSRSLAHHHHHSIFLFGRISPPSSASRLRFFSFFCNWLCNSIRCQSKSIFGWTSKLMLPIWQVKRKMDIHSTMQRFPSSISSMLRFLVVEFCFFLLSFICFAFLGMNLILLCLSKNKLFVSKTTSEKCF